jgi:UDP-N-acetylmuramoyl-tripeptide--D-alanyl-D-alanine ligase
MTREAIAEAHDHRERLREVTFIAVTGSCGKTTTKDLAAAVLGSRFCGSKNDDTRNCGPDVARAVLRVRPDDDFFVQELGAWGPGTLDPGIRLVQPDVAVVTNLRNDHYSSLRGPRGAQAEKGKLVRSVPATGAAILNADDPLVRDLAASTPARTLSFGRSAEADLRAADVSARWPRRLSFAVGHEGRSTRVQTQLLGEHLLGSALAALGVAIALGMDLEEAGDALARARPSFRRMSCVTHPDGVTFIRDDWKAPLDSVADALAFMEDAVAPRKVAVLGTISDFPGRSRRTYSRVAWEAMAAVDAAIFVGERATALWGEQRRADPAAQADLRRRILSGLDGPAAAAASDADRLGQLFVFERVQDATAFAREYLSAGDLVLVKASGPADHLERLLLDREEPATCWEARCGRVHPCDTCEALRRAPAPVTATVPG